MIELNGCEISKILGKKCKDLEKIKVNKVSTDSRDVDENTVFFALKGDKFDGHDFIADVLEKGCPLVVASHITDDIDKNKVILVRDTLKSLGKLGRYNRMQYKGKVIAITGSAGKTTTKEELKEALSVYGKTYATPKNFNNFVGVPLTLLNIDMESKFTVIEMGMSARKEIKYLSGLAMPDVAVVTNVFPMHLEFLKTIRNIAKAKAEIFYWLDKSKIAVFNQDSMCADVLFKEAVRHTGKIITFGKNNHPQIRIKSLSSAMEYNAWCVMSVLSALELDVKKAKKVIADFGALEGRGKIYNLNVGDRKIVLIDDSYSGQPEAMKLAVKELAKVKGRKVALLGKMAELGTYTRRAHIEVGQILATHKIDVVIGVGPETKDMLGVLPKTTEQYYFDNIEGMNDFLKNVILRDGDTLLIKGAHYSSAVFKVADYLKAYAV